MIIVQTEEMKLRAEMRAKPTHELRSITESPDIDVSVKIMAREILWEGGKLLDALPVR